MAGGFRWRTIALLGLLAASAAYSFQRRADVVPAVADFFTERGLNSTNLNRLKEIVETEREEQRNLAQKSKELAGCQSQLETRGTKLTGALGRAAAAERTATGLESSVTQLQDQIAGTYGNRLHALYINHPADAAQLDTFLDQYIEQTGLYSIQFPENAPKSVRGKSGWSLAFQVTDPERAGEQVAEQLYRSIIADVEIDPSIKAWLADKLIVELGAVPDKIANPSGNGSDFVVLYALDSS